MLFVGDLYAFLLFLLRADGVYGMDAVGIRRARECTTLGLWLLMDGGWPHLRPKGPEEKHDFAQHLTVFS